MPTSRERLRFEHGRHELVRVSHSGLGRRELLRRAAEVLAEAVPFDGGCWHTHDPATLLITSHQTNLDGSGFAPILHNEYLQPDVNKFADLARRRQPAAVLAGTGDSARLRERRRAELRATFGAAEVTCRSTRSAR